MNSRRVRKHQRSVFLPLFSMYEWIHADLIQYRMALNLHLQSTETRGCAHLSTNAIDESVFQAIVSNLEMIVNRISSNPNQSLAQILTVGPEAQSQLQLRPPGVHAECIHWLIQKRAAHQPNAQAIIAPDASYTYIELDMASSCLAKHFLYLGVQRHSMVALCFQKSALAVVAMLATLKAGGVCVPLDPGHPVSRHRAVLDKTKARLIVNDVASRQSIADLPTQDFELSHCLLASLVQTLS